MLNIWWRYSVLVLDEEAGLGVSGGGGAWLSCIACTCGCVGHWRESMWEKGVLREVDVRICNLLCGVWVVVNVFCGQPHLNGETKLFHPMFRLAPLNRSTLSPHFL